MPGSSGNPGGRPKEVVEAKRVIDGMAAKAAAVLEEILDDEEDAALRRQVARDVLMWSIGRPREAEPTVTLEGLVDIVELLSGRATLPKRNAQREEE
jgi:hypothetical protein